MLKTNAYILEETEIENLFTNTHASGISISVFGNVSLEYDNKNLMWAKYDFYNILNLSNEIVSTVSSIAMTDYSKIHFFIKWEVVLELINRKFNTDIQSNQIKNLLFEEKKKAFYIIMKE